MTEKGYWLPWINEEGELQLEGPWDTIDEGLRVSEIVRPLVGDSSNLGQLFYASSRDEAERRTKLKA